MTSSSPVSKILSILPPQCLLSQELTLSIRSKGWHNKSSHWVFKATAMDSPTVLKGRNLKSRYRQGWLSGGLEEEAVPCLSLVASVVAGYPDNIISSTSTSLVTWHFP